MENGSKNHLKLFDRCVFQRITHVLQYLFLLFTIIFIIIGISASTAIALPKNGEVVHGDDKKNTIETIENTMTVTQKEDVIGIKWDSFSIKANETVIFEQPNTSSTCFNFVTGKERSILEGKLEANGKVVLINPNGFDVGNNFLGKAEASNLHLGVAKLKGIEKQIREGEIVKLKVSEVKNASIIFNGEHDLQGNKDLHKFTYVAPHIKVRPGGDGSLGKVVASVTQIETAELTGYTIDLHGDQLITFTAAQVMTTNAGNVQGDDGGESPEQVVWLKAGDAVEILNGVTSTTGVMRPTEINSQGNITAGSVKRPRKKAKLVPDLLSDDESGNDFDEQESDADEEDGFASDLDLSDLSEGESENGEGVSGSDTGDESDDDEDKSESGESVPGSESDDNSDDDEKPESESEAEKKGSGAETSKQLPMSAAKSNTDDASNNLPQLQDPKKSNETQDDGHISGFKPNGKYQEGIDAGEENFVDDTVVVISDA